MRFQACLAALVAVLLAHAAAAQTETGGVRGRVVEARGGGPVAGVWVVAHRGRDTAAAGRALTGADGRFHIGGLAGGAYTLRVPSRAAGDAPARTLNVTAGADADAGELAVGAVALAGIEVRAERPGVVHAEDRNIYNVRDMPAAGTASDVIRTLPELEITPEGAIRLVGNRDAVVYVNGRLSPLKGNALTEFIRNLPAGRIDRIEVIPNPSVRYESGNAAIVNIVLRRDLRAGLSGSVSANAATRGGNGASTQLAFQRGRLTIFGGGSALRSTFLVTELNTRENLAAEPRTVLVDDRETGGSNDYLSGDVTAEYTVGARGTLWSSGALHAGRSEYDMNSDSELQNAAREPLRIFERTFDQRARAFTADLAVGFRRIVEAGRHELSLELRRTGTGRAGRGDFEDEVSWSSEPIAPYQLRLRREDADEGNLTAKADYSRPLGGGRRIEVGGRLTSGTQSNGERVELHATPDRADPTRVVRNETETTERQQSAYATVSQKIGRLTLQGGLRAEAIGLSIDIRRVADRPRIAHDHFSVSPSLNAALQIREGLDARASYNRRTDRLYYWMLNPYVEHTDDWSRVQGNPELEPSETHSFSGDLSWRGKRVTLRLAPYLRRTNSEIEYVRTVDSAGVITAIPQNLTALATYGSTVSAALRPAPWGSASVSAGFTRDEREAEGLPAGLTVASTSTFVSTTTSVKRGGLTVQGWVRLNSPRETLQRRYATEIYSQLALRQEFLGGRSAVDVRIADPFGLTRSRYEIRAGSFSSSSADRGSMSSRTVSASLTYRFGRAPERKSSTSERPSVGSARVQ